MAAACAYDLLAHLAVNAWNASARVNACKRMIDSDRAISTYVRFDVSVAGQAVAKTIVRANHIRVHMITM